MPAKRNNSFTTLLPWLLLLVMSVGLIWLWRKPGGVPALSLTVEKYTGPTEITQKFLSETVTLPKASTRGSLSVEQAIFQRRSKREFLDKPLTLAQISQLSWSIQGVTDPATGHRTAPSAREAYPLELYLIVFNVSGLKPGFYHYSPANHQLQPISYDLKREDLLAAANNQDPVKNAQAVFVLTGIATRTQAKMPDSPKSAVLSTMSLEAGHAAQNFYLELESLRLGGVVVAGYDGAKLSKLLGFPGSQVPLYLLPFGWPK
jgi:SagB-type dehydrogenase family enzyme